MAVLPTGIGPVTGYNIERSLRFNSADSAYLNRTPASAGNRKTWTWSGWVKRGALGTAQMIFNAWSGTSTQLTNLQIDAGNTITYYYDDGSTNYRFVTSQVFRDPSSWYHIVLAIDTTQATNTNRAKLYINGSQVTAFSQYDTFPQNSNTYVNATNTHNIGRYAFDGTRFFNGYMTEMNFIDGSAKTPSDFGETDSNTGVWKPKAYSGTYGTNGFYLKFADNSGTTSTTLGKDSSGNGNNWTPNNFSVTAGAGNDSLVDSPTSYGTDTGVGGEVRGNYATLNPLRPTSSGGFSNGNLTGTAETGAQQGLCSTITLPWSGKWYAEVTFASQINNWCGVTSVDKLAADINTVGQMSVLYYALNGNKYVNGTATAYGASYTTETIGIAFDGLAGTVTFYKANVSQGAITLPSLTVNYVFCQANAAGSAIAANWNFGQRPFAYTAPSGFKALCTTNLPTPTIGATSTTQANDYFDATTYSGNSSTQSIVNAGGFQPDLVWWKRRDTASGHGLADSVRGATKSLSSSSTAAELTTTDGFVGFNSNGFALNGPGSTNYDTNYTGGTYIAWQWNAGGSNATNTSGTITSTVRANTTSGFSIVTYTGNGTAGATVGHGLGVAPSMVIVKCRSNGASNWPVYHSAIAPNNSVWLSLTNGSTASLSNFNNTATTSTLVTLGDDTNVNGSTRTYVAYCFAPVAGYSAFGSYTGNGSTDGPFVYTGFRPRFVMVKRTDSTGDWIVEDAGRNAYNLTNLFLLANSSTTEGVGDSTNVVFDFLSNGFKLRGTAANGNASGGTYIYAAFAEVPMKYSLGR